VTWLRAACAAALVAACSLAAAPSAGATVTAQTLIGSASPTSQQPTTRGPAQLTFGFDTTYNTPGTPSPQLTDVTWFFDDDFAFNLTGVPQCNPASLNNGSGNLTTAQAIAACPNSVIGTGTAMANGALPSTVTAFNGTEAGGGADANGVPGVGTGPMVYLHIYYDGSVIPFTASTKVAGGRLTMTNPVHGPDFAAQYRLNGIGLPTAPGLAFTHLSVTLKDPPSGQDFVTARCNDNDATWNFDGFFDFSGQQNFSPTATQACTKVGNTLTVSKTGTGTGTVTGNRISCPADCTDVYEPGDTVTLTAAPGSGSTFTGWSGGCSGNATTCVVTMDAAKAVTADFAANPGTNPLTVNLTGTGTGTVTSSPSGINCPGICSAPFAPGAVTLTAAPTGGSTFAGWSGEGCSGTGTCVVTMDQARTVTASFTAPVPQHTLTVSKTGSGFGTVTSSPAGINCPGDCTESFDENTPVTLTATPSGASTFVDWGGDCPSDTSPPFTCQLTMSANKIAGVSFSAGQANFVVNTTDDGPDASTNGVCLTSGGMCTLRAAVAEANATSIADNITFSVNGEHHSPSPSFGQPFLTINTPMTITGNGDDNDNPPATVIDGDNVVQVFNISSTAGAVTLRNLRVQNGRNTLSVPATVGTTASGGAIQVAGTQNPPAPSLTLDNVTVANSSVENSGGTQDRVARGGGVFAGNGVTLSLTNTVVKDNIAKAVATGSKATGAGIYALGATTIVDSTVSGNMIDNTGNTTMREGAGIAADNFATVSLLRSTVSENDAGSDMNGTGTGNGAGGGIRITGAGSMTITNSTISGNKAGSAGGGGVQTSVATTISASTLAANAATGGSGADVLAGFTTTTAKSSIFASPGACARVSDGTLSSAGRNLDNGTSCGFGTANGNLQNTNPLLGTLQNNGGLTFTHALMAGSPAIDAGSAVAGVTTDQRGVTRPQGAGCDIGAYEFSSSPGASCVATAVPVPTPVPIPPDPVVPKKKCKKGQKLKKGKCVKARKKKK
jgi:CSLREA domain-containing protein